MISDNGLDLVDVYLGPDGVLTGSARETQQLNEQTGIALHNHAVSRKDREIQRKRSVLDSKIANLKEEFESYQEEINKTYIEEQLRREVMEQNRSQLTSKRDGNQK